MCHTYYSMPKTKRKSSRRSLYLILGLSLTLALGYVAYRSMLTPSDIFVIQESPVTYGDTTVTGTLRKDTAVGEVGNYILVLDDGRPVLLDAQGLDGLLGATVSVSGTLSPSPDSLSPMTMIVNTIEVAN